MANMRKKSEGKAGMAMARTWAVTHGSAWVTASDVMEFPGIFAEYATFQSCTRAMARAGIFLEDQQYTERAKLYRMNPTTVKAILG